MNRARKDTLILALVLIGAIAFVAWEQVALIPTTAIHTVSYWAHQYIWFRFLIAVILPIVFGTWFWHHATEYVPK